MAKYDVYGIGNALVDMEYEVEIADLEALGIDKGVMTLVDEDHQLRIMNHLAAHAHQRSSGGSAANSMIAVRQFGDVGEARAPKPGEEARDARLVLGEAHDNAVAVLVPDARVGDEPLGRLRVPRVVNLLGVVLDEALQIHGANDRRFEV